MLSMVIEFAETLELYLQRQHQIKLLIIVIITIILEIVDIITLKEILESSRDNGVGDCFKGQIEIMPGVSGEGEG